MEQLYPDPVKMCRELRDVLGLADISDLTDVPFPDLWQEALQEAEWWTIGKKHGAESDLAEQARAIFD